MTLKRVIIALSLCFSLLSAIQAAVGNGDALMKEAKAKYEQKEFTPARFLYKQAYNAFAASGDYAKAVECGVKVSSLYHREYLYKEAFDLCRAMDQMVAMAEQKQQKMMYELHFAIAKEREEMFLKLKNPAQAKMMLTRLEEIAGQSGSKELKEELGYSKMTYHYAFGQIAEGDAYLKDLVNLYQGQKNYAKVSECYRNLITIAVRANNAPLVNRTYKKLMEWEDTAKSLTAQDELSKLMRRYKECKQIIQEKEDALSSRKHLIVGLFTIIVILIVILAALVILQLRNLAVISKQKKTIQIANEHNDLKSEFISNISGQMAPALDSLDQSASMLAGVQHMRGQINALKDFTSHIQELTMLENSLSQTFDMNDSCDVAKLGQELIADVKEFLKPDVSTSIDITALQLKTNTEKLRYILRHLLYNAAYYTENGKITLEFKKRGAHMYQFAVTDTGIGIPAEKREKIFKPFSDIKDLTQGDGLGLPICSLVAMKLNGSLTLDTTYTKGCRFVLKINA